MKKTKKLVYAFIFSSLIMLSTFFIGKFYIYKGNSPDMFNIANLIHYKKNYAQSIKTQKIIITSGSNSLYGLSAEAIEKTFNIPTVNNAVNADLQLKYHLYSTKVILKEGDIVILPLEYRVFNYKKNVKYQKERKYTAVYDKQYFVNKYGLKELINYYQKLGIGDFVRSLKLEKQFKGKQYIGKIINRNGDILVNRQHRKIMWDNPREIQNIDYATTDGFKLLKEFRKYCVEHDVLLFITFPNTIYYRDYEKDAYKKYFKNLYITLIKNNFNVLGNPYVFMYPRKLFFNTAYHLNQEGTKVRTKEFINILKENALFIRAIK